MDIRGFIKVSMVDWDGKIVSTIFTPKCNLSCPYCFNYPLLYTPEKYKRIPEKEVIEYLNKNRDFIDGVCISGGEPSIQKGLTKFCGKIKKLGFGVKVDTNGTNPDVIKELIRKGIVDYFAMDIKAPFIKYTKVAGKGAKYLINKIKESVQILLKNEVEYEFRTTFIPAIHTDKDIEEIAKEIRGANLYVLQKFKPENVADKKLKAQKTQSDEEMERLVEIIKKYVKKAKWRE